ncbi:hypothetical protein CBR_g8382 [Chara braunii]|uniref:Uncharacterized protein n=1 Tax=Chara braunii TaxID=69332 RepID=A0A388KM16_CHABU|nr:hypothetical protein CBR_g8382 [Chara braunii]|eukprot:GBG71082.1 hypothetical protein CBR_g8382 [Chara braunii]
MCNVVSSGVRPKALASRCFRQGCWNAIHEESSLGRYNMSIAMSRTMGLVFNPEAIELFTVNKMFVAYTWCKARGVEKPQAKLSAMMKMLGFSPDPVLFDIIERTGDIIEVESR